MAKTEEILPTALLTRYLAKRRASPSPMGCLSRHVLQQLALWYVGPSGLLVLFVATAHTIQFPPVPRLRPQRLLFFLAPRDPCPRPYPYLRSSFIRGVEHCRPRPISSQLPALAPTHPIPHLGTLPKWTPYIFVSSRFFLSLSIVMFPLRR